MSDTLSKEAVLDIIKTRRTYGHEAEALGREVLALRDERDRGPVPQGPSAIADRLRSAFFWSETPQGESYWLAVYRNLKALELNPP